MKIQIIKIIPCLLAGFILSACVGAVNVPEGAVDSIKTSVEDKEPEPIVVKPANPCIANPFGDTCGADFNNARKAICTESNSNQCAPIIKRVCEADSLDALCADEESYFLAQYATCRRNNTNPRCALTIRRICDNNIFDRLCDGLATYYPAQKTACASELNSARCVSTIRRVCENDIFNRYCSKATAYNSARKAACERMPLYADCGATIERVCNENPFNPFCYNDELYLSDSYFYERKKTCINEPFSDRCVPIVAKACGADSRDQLCKAQEFACSYARNSRKCAPIIERVCTKDSLDKLCNRLTTYYPAQEMACASEPDSPRCAPTLARVCGKNAFDALCLSKNLTLKDIPTPPSNIFQRNDGGSWGRGGCRPDWRTYRISYDYACFVGLPSGIDSDTSIEPLNSNNSGTATYAGSVSVEYLVNRPPSSSDDDRIKNITKNIDITVDFELNTLSYSGNLGLNAFNISSFSNSGQITFNINGSFTDRGQITGSVRFNGAFAHTCSRCNYEGITGDLFGLIGQNEMFGIFGGGDGDEFAGGFTATRK